MCNIPMMIYYAVLFYVCLPGLYFDGARLLRENVDISIDRNIVHAVVFAILVKLTHKWAWETSWLFNYSTARC